MPFVLADRVKETSNTTGTGTFVLAGPSTGFQSFAVIGDGNTTYYTIQNPGTNEWEVGIGTYYSANTSIVRTTVFSSSNANSVVSFSSGTKDVFVTYPSENAVTTLIANTFTNNQVISVNSSSNALTITQTGSGNALVVEDSANPDATPFVVDASGNVGIGITPTSKFNIYDANALSVVVESDTSVVIQETRYSDDANGAAFTQRKARGTRASPTVVANNDVVGGVNFNAYDGSTYRGAAQIQARVDGTPGASDMPGRLVFLLTADGASTTTERMRIASDGTTTIGAAPGAESLRVGPVASAVNRIEAFGATTGNSPYIFANGSDTNVNLTIYSKGASGIFLDTNASTATAFGVELGASTTVNRDTYIDFHSSSGTDYDFRIIRNSGVNGSAEYINAGTAGHVFRTNAASQQFTVAHTASAVNYLQVTGAATGGSPVYSAQGSDSNINLVYTTKGVGFHNFTNGSGQAQFVVTSTSSAVNYVQATGSATGNAVAISAQGNDANVSISIAAKGSGNVTVSGNLTANLTTTTSGPFDSGTGATWTNPRTRATWATIELWGAGGGGGGSASGGAGGGGGGGAYFTITVPFSYLGTTETYTVGGGGANVSTNTNGGAGGNTTFTVTNWPGGSKTFTAYGGGGGGGASSTSGYAGGGGGGVLSAGGTAAATVFGQGGQPLSAVQVSGGGNEGYGGAAGSAAQTTQGGAAYYGGGGGGNGENGTGTGTTGLGGNSVYGGGGGGGGNDSGTVRCPGGTSVFGGKGGDGGYGNNTTPAQDGTVPGGGGGGSDLGTAGSGNGASGRVLITIW